MMIRNDFGTFTDFPVPDDDQIVVSNDVLTPKRGIFILMIPKPYQSHSH